MTDARERAKHRPRRGTPASSAGEHERTVVRYEPGTAEKNPKRFTRRRRTLELSLAAGVPVGLLLVWQVAFDLEWIDQRYYASPWGILTSDLLGESRLWEAVWISVWRMLQGFVAGAGAAFVVGLLMGVSRTVRAALDPLLTALYTVPKLALIPVFVMIFGFGDLPLIALIAVTVFFFVWISTMSAIMGVPEGYREVASSFGASRWQQFRHVLFPGALPQIFVGLRISAGVAVLIMIGVELVLSSDGLGELIEQGRTLFLPEYTYVGVALSALIGLVFTLLIRFLGRLLLPWAPDDKGMGQM